VSCRQPWQVICQANDPDHNQFLDLSYFAQTLGDKGEKLTIAKKSLIGGNLYEGVS
jgi:hypothetical protein